jgi:transposase
MKVMHPNASGIDIGATKHYVAAPKDRSPEPVRSFGCFTEDLDELVNWLKSCKIDTVAMESTFVYWFPLYNILELKGKA